LHFFTERRPAEKMQPGSAGSCLTSR
jgi:hypothetical protein